MLTKNSKPGKRGRPPGRTAEGEATRRQLYETAIQLIAERGYEGATLREVANRADVSPTLLYRYFPNKRAVVLALYDELSEAFAAQVALPAGRWRDRFVRALGSSLEVLGPHRVTLRALAPVMIGDTEEGVFRDAVLGAKDAPPAGLAQALGRLLYLLHLGVVLWWLLDRSPRQRATRGLVGLLERVMPSAALALKLPIVRGFVTSADALFEEGLLGRAEGTA